MNKLPDTKEPVKTKITALKELPRQCIQWWSAGRKQKMIAVGGILAVLVLVIGFAVYFSKVPLSSIFVRSSENLFEGFSKLTANPDAKNAFQLKATLEDSTGIDPASTYTLSSVEALTTDDLKKLITVSPNVSFSLAQRSGNEWELALDQALTPNTIFKIALNDPQEDGKESDVYEWAFQVKDTFKVLHYLPRDTATNVPLKTGIEVTFSHENFTDEEAYVSIDPPVPGRFEKHGRTLVYVPTENLAPSQIYRVTVKKGLPLSGSDATLQEDLVFAFETVTPIDEASNNSWLRTYQKLQDVSASEPPLIQLWARNLEQNSVNVDVYPVKDEAEYLQILNRRDQLPWWSHTKDRYLENTSDLRALTSFTAPLQEESGVQFIRFTEPLPHGYFVIDLKNNKARDQVLMQVTDAAAYVNVSKNKTVIWAADLSAKQPSANAQIELIGTERRFIANDQGVAVFETPQELLKASSDQQENKRSYFKVSTGENEVIIPATFLSRNDGYWSGNDAQSYWKYLYTDRPLYQPTDTVKFWGLLRNRDRERITKPVTITLMKEGYVDYYYRPIVIETKTVDVDAQGTFTGEISLKNMQTDVYVLELRVGDDVIENKYIEIRPYDKPAYQLTLTPETNVAYAGDDITLEAQASFFEGTPVPELPLIFETSNGTQRVVTDADGKVTLHTTEAYKDCSNEYRCWPAYEWAKIRPELSEVAEIESSAQLRFYGPEVDATVDVTYPEAAKARLEVRAHKIDLEKIAERVYQDPETQTPSAGTKIEGEIIKITYTRKEMGTGYDFINKRTYKIYSYTREEKAVDTFSGITDERGASVYERTLEPKTSYRVKLRYYDANGRYDATTAYLYYYDGVRINNYGDDGYNNYRLKLPEDNAFSVGEQVRVDFVNNDEMLQAGGQNHYLFLQQQDGLQEYAASQDPTYQFPFEERDIPNVNITGVYFTGETFIMAETGWFDNSVLFDKKDKTMQIEITPDKSRYEPGDEVTVSIRTRNASNQPVSAAVNMNLIDEAFYAVLDSSANPIDSIYAGIGSGVVFSTYSHRRPISPYGGAEKGGCFLGGTQIQMADGSSKAIEDIQVGDEVLTLADPRRNETVSGTVTELYRHTISEYLIINQDLRVTPEHIVYANLGFKPAGQLKIGDWMLQRDGRKVFVASIEAKREIVPVYNFAVEPYHTYFANGYFVHNEKGGGPREYFTDAALFQTITTDASGWARTTFTLPDNITSWRVTAQGISSSLDVGVSVSKIPVSLPVFAEVGIGKEYVADDEPVARIRSYGTAFTKESPVTLSLLSPDLNISTPITKSSHAFQSEFFPLPKLAVGTYDVTYRIDAKEGSDSLILPLSVIESRLTAQRTQAYDTANMGTISNETDRPMRAVLTDQKRSAVYQTLRRLSWVHGDRIDQGLTRTLAAQLLNTAFEANAHVPEFTARQYQTSSGGLTLLPYSSEDLELSAMVAGVGMTGFDETALTQYFFRKLEDRNSNTEEVSLALYGLAAMNQPVLPRLRAWITRDDLSVTQKLYLALAMCALGDTQPARTIYADILREYGWIKEPHIVIKAGETDDEILKNTELASVLASRLNEPQQYGMQDYLRRHRPSEILPYLEELAFAKANLSRLSGKTTAVEFNLNGKDIRADLKQPSFSYSFQLDPKSTIRVTKTEPDIVLTTTQPAPLTEQDLKTDESISIRREYYVNGQKTNTFTENDLIEVRLTPEFKDGALDGSYQITDILPSGLLPIAKLSRDSQYDCRRAYPYAREGQYVKYMIRRDNRCNSSYIMYYAKARTKGTYKAEPALMQSMLNPDYLNVTPLDEIVIQ